MMGKIAEKFETPTPQQQAHAGYVIERETKAGQTGKPHYRRVRQLEALHIAGSLTNAEYSALKHYRHHADITERSLVRDSLAFQLPGGGTSDGPGMEVLNAIRIASDIERAVGVLADILRAVVVEDQSLTQWAIQHHGSKEECYTRGSKQVCQIKPIRRGFKLAQLDFRLAVIRVLAHLQ